MCSAVSGAAFPGRDELIREPQISVRDCLGRSEVKNIPKSESAVQGKHKKSWMNGNSELHRLKVVDLCIGSQSSKPSWYLGTVANRILGTKISAPLRGIMPANFPRHNSYPRSWDCCTKNSVSNASKVSEFVPAVFVPLCANPIYPWWGDPMAPSWLIT